MNVGEARPHQAGAYAANCSTFWTRTVIAYSRGQNRYSSLLDDPSRSVAGKQPILDVADLTYLDFMWGTPNVSADVRRADFAVRYNHSVCDRASSPR